MKNFLKPTSTQLIIKLIFQLLHLISSQNNNNPTNSLSIPSITSDSLSGPNPLYYTLPTPSNGNPTLIYVTLNLCSPPPSRLQDLPLSYPSLLIVSNSSSHQSIEPQHLPSSKHGAYSSTYAGFANVTLINSEGLWIKLYSPTPSTNDPWSFQLAISDSQRKSLPIHHIHQSDILHLSTFSHSSGQRLSCLSLRGHRFDNCPTHCC